MQCERGGRVQKMAVWGNFQGITGVTRERMGFKKLQHWVDVFYGWIFDAVIINRP